MITKNKILLIVDWEISNSEFWLKKELENLDYEVELLGLVKYNRHDRIVKWRKIILWYTYILTSIKSLKISKNGDIIISWNFIIGAFVAFWAKMFRIKRKVISLNIIAHEKGFLNEIIRKLVYNYAFRYKNFYASINSEQLISHYSKYFCVDVSKYFVISDPYSPNYEQADYFNGDNYVFSGGEGGRDWETLLKAAELLPDIKFVIVARKKYFNNNLLIPNNIVVYFDTSEEVFYQLLTNSTIVALPLNSLAPAGLIVLIRAALLCKPVVATETPSIKTYVKHLRTGLLNEMNDYEGLAKNINLLMCSESVRREYANNLKNYIVSEYSYRKYVEKIESFLKYKEWV